MNTRLFFLSVCLFLLAIANLSCYSLRTQSGQSPRKRSFDEGWRFTRDSLVGAEQVNFDDANWRQLDLPHDWSIEDLPEQVEGETIGPFSKKSPGARSTGHTIGGTGWYRKAFVVDNDERDKLFSLYFEGAYMETDVYVNGRHAAYHPYGYTSFFVDITKYLNSPGERNIIAVRVRNIGKNSRWYSGSGIYRHVWLIATNRQHIDHWGLQVTTPTITANEATVKLDASIRNEGRQPSDVVMRTKIFDPQGRLVAQKDSTIHLVAESVLHASQSLSVTSPRLWSLQTPVLYIAEVLLLVNGNETDRYTASFGIRSIEITATNGFQLNGEKIKLRGGCIHHDNGILGAVAIDRAEERKIELLKASGFNAIRSSHNPPSEKLLEACDRLGMLVINEPFDHWQKAKNPEDYHRFFDKYWEEDFSSMILRDRNHPSIFLWSIGNEIPERANPEGLEITKKLISKAKELDPTRLVTEAICDFWDNPGKTWPDSEPAFALLDVGGYNYMWGQYEKDHAKFPQRIMVGTESVPKQAFQNWELIEKHEYIIGDFVWTAMDYLGESGIGHATCDTATDYQLRPWPWFNANCGDIDLIGYKRSQSLYRDVLWRNSKIEMVVHTPMPNDCKENVSYWGWPDEFESWTWPGNEDRTMDVAVYSRAPLIRLYLNNKLVGEQKLVDSNMLTARFKVPYAPGILRAVMVEGGKETTSKILTTAGNAVRIRLVADRKNIKASRNDLSYVTVEVVDAKGSLVPNADKLISFSLTADAELAAVGNANPSEMASFKQPVRKTYRGRCMAIVRPTGKPGKATLTAKAEGVETAQLQIEISE